MTFLMMWFWKIFGIIALFVLCIGTFGSFMPIVDKDERKKPRNERIGTAATGLIFAAIGLSLAFFSWSQEKLDENALTSAPQAEEGEARTGSASSEHRTAVSANKSEQQAQPATDNSSNTNGFIGPFQYGIWQHSTDGATGIGQCNYSKEVNVYSKDGQNSCYSGPDSCGSGQPSEFTPIPLANGNWVDLNNETKTTYINGEKPGDIIEHLEAVSPFLLIRHIGLTKSTFKLLQGFDVHDYRCDHGDGAPPLSFRPQGNVPPNHQTIPESPTITAINNTISFFRGFSACIDQQLIIQPEPLMVSDNQVAQSILDQCGSWTTQSMQMCRALGGSTEDCQSGNKQFLLLTYVNSPISACTAYIGRRLADANHRIHIQFQGASTGSDGKLYEGMAYYVDTIQGEQILDRKTGSGFCVIDQSNNVLGTDTEVR